MFFNGHSVASLHVGRSNVKRQSQGDDNPQGRIQKYELGGHEGVGSRPLPYAPPPLPVP